MSIKKHFIRLGAYGDGAHGFIVQCDACRRHGPDGATQQEVAMRARREVFATVKHRQGNKDIALHICRLCLAEWPVALNVTEFIARKRIRRQRQRGGVQ